MPSAPTPKFELNHGTPRGGSNPKPLPSQGQAPTDPSTRVSTTPLTDPSTRVSGISR